MLDQLSPSDKEQYEIESKFWTLFSGHIGKELTESDLANIKDFWIKEMRSYNKNGNN